MSFDRAYNLVRLSLIAALVLGGLVLLFSEVWVPVYQAHTVDVILNPDELRERKLIEVVNRTHRYNASRQSHLVMPYRVLGGMMIASATVGLLALHVLPRPLVPGITGMRDHRSP